MNKQKHGMEMTMNASVSNSFSNFYKSSLTKLVLCCIGRRMHSHRQNNMSWSHLDLCKNCSRSLIVVVRGRSILCAAVLNAHVCFLVLLCRGRWFWKAATQEPCSVLVSAGGEALLDWIIFSSVRGWKQQWGGRRSFSFLEQSEQSPANEQHTSAVMEISMLRPEPQFPVTRLPFYFACMHPPTRVIHCANMLITVWVICWLCHYDFLFFYKSVLVCKHTLHHDT